MAAERVRQHAGLCVRGCEGFENRVYLRAHGRFLAYLLRYFGKRAVEETRRWQLLVPVQKVALNGILGQ